MKAILLSRHGGPGVLRVTEIPTPDPGPGEVRVKVEAVGLNYAEVLSRKGLYGWAPRLPYVPGMEAVGRIDRVGEGVDPARVGEAVVVGAQHGAYAEWVVARSAQALPAPRAGSGEAFTMEENAAFTVNWMTAWVGLMEMGRLRPTDRVLVSPAGGGVGTAAVAIAAAFGCEVVALAGSDAKLDRVRGLGASRTVNYRRPGWREALAAEVGPRGVDVALEMVGGGVFQGVKSVLAPFGRVVVAGYAELDYTLWNPFSWWRAWRGTPRMGLTEMFKGSNGILSTHLGYLLRDPERVAGVWGELTAFVRTHGLRPAVGHVLPFEEMADAHRLMESRESYGKIVLRMPEAGA
ncbi:MAG: zinc-binding dehydrogenase [Gemmatimonadota bacterium]|nr:zinc-binding dehydrogenase [Gemmatimonadota bacterium]MDH5760658.1 zinc-binding dehydrogenase [Gemmatimonadota bacterium]